MLPSAGPQYKDVASVQQVGALAKKGADKIAKGATVARNVQQKVKTAELGKIRKEVRERKASYEKSQADQKASLDARTEAEEMATFEAAKAKRPTDARILRITKNLESGYQPAGPSVSVAQQRTPGKVKQAVTDVVNDVKTEAVKETKNAVGNAVADVVNSEEFAEKAKGVGAGIGAAAGAALTKSPKGAAVGAQIGTGAAEVVTKVAQNVVNKRAQRGKK